MTWTSSTALVRVLDLSPRVFVPTDGQSNAVDFLLTHPKAMLWADVGAGKTGIVLEAFRRARESSREPLQMLVVCSKRILQLVWRQEAAQWAQFQGLTFGALHGPKKDKILREPPKDIYLVTYGGLAWLRKQFPRGIPWPICVADEVTKIKAYSTDTHKNLCALTENTPIKWGLTATPNPNGYMDLFGQFKWLSHSILGQFVTHFRDMYFIKGFIGFDYDLQHGGAARIEAQISPLVFRLPYTDKPPLTVNPIWLKMEGKELAAYKAMKRDQIQMIDGHMVTAVNSGALQAKLEQMANGAVYDDKKTGYLHIHDLKLDALEDLVDELQGQPLIVAYQFQHDMARLKERFGDKEGIAYFADAASEKKAQKLQDDWNAGKIKILFVHPASVGHGLNLQRGGASHICWFSGTFNYEFWEQLNGRLARRGNPADRVTAHLLLVKGTIDELKLAAVDAKGLDMAQLLQAVHILVSEDHEGEDEVSNVQRLGNQADGSGAPAQPQQWGGPAAAPAAAAPQTSWGPPAGAPQQVQQTSAPAQGSWGPPAGAPANPQVEQRVQQAWTPPVAQAQQNWAPPANAEPAAPVAQQYFSPAVVAAAPPAQDPNAGWAQPAQTAEAPAETSKPKSRAKKPTGEDPPVAGLSGGLVQEYAGAKFAPSEHEHHLTINITGPVSVVRDLLRKLAQ